MYATMAYFSEDIADFIILSCLGSVMLSIAAMVIFPIVSYNYPPIEKRRIDHKVEIYSLRNTENLQGQFFFLGGGYIDQQEYYYMFIKDEKGGFNRFKLEASNSTIYQDADETPYVYWQEIVTATSPQVTWFNIESIHNTLYELHVPKNTIIQQFKVN